MNPPNRKLEPSREVKESAFKTFLAKLKKRHIIETFAGFIAGGWLVLEFVDRILVAHYHINEKWLDVAFFTLLGALLCVILWRWFSGTEKRPGNVKVEVLLVPLIILVTLAIDLNLTIQIAGITGKKLLIGVTALCLGVAWIIFKSLQWAANIPEPWITAGVLKPIEEKPLSFPEWKSSIVVLPFDNISPEAGQDYFCDGMTEEIITDLSKVRDLLVISRNSAMTFKGTKKKTDEIARELKVGYVLEGSVRKAGNDIRITAQLIDATNDAHLWAEKYSGTLDEVFKIQESVSHSIVKALRIKLSPEEYQNINERPFENIQAYECYAKARQEMLRFTDQSLGYALQLLQNGLEIMGENEDLFAGMALTYIYCYDAGINRDENTLLKAEEFIQKVKKLKPDSHYYHHLQGRLERFRGSAINSIGHLKKALVINPNNVDALLFQGYLLAVFAGKPNLAEPYVKRLLDIDPLTPMSYFAPMMFYSSKGELDLAVETARKSLKMDPENRWSKYFLSRMLSLAGQLDEAFEVIDNLATEDSKDLVGILSLFSKYALQSERDKALLILTEDARKYSWNDPEWPLYMTGYYSLISEKEEAFRWLEHTINRGLINYPLLSETDPFLAKLREEPRFKKLMERVKYEWEHFEV